MVPGNYTELTDEQVQNLLQQTVDQVLTGPERKKFRNECDHQYAYSSIEDLNDHTWAMYDSYETSNNEDEVIELINKIFIDSPETARMVISNVLHEIPACEYAKETGQSPSNVSHKPSRALKKLKKFL